MLTAFNKVPQRIWQKVVATPSGCWLWTGALDRHGYGKTSFAGQRAALLHRVMYRLLVGPIPEGLTIDHLCRNRNCQQPAHLEAVTKRENTLRGVGSSARHARQTECKRGHSFSDPANVISKKSKYGRPKRNCRLCHNAGQRSRYQQAHPLHPEGYVGISAPRSISAGGTGEQPSPPA